MHPATNDVPALGASPILRSPIAIGLAPTLRGRLETLSAGRALVIDFFASRCCTSVWVGDITAGWLQRGDDRSELVSLAAIDGVAVFADPRLLDLLATAGPTLRLAGPTFARHLAIELDDAAAWLAFLETPAGHRRSRATRPRRLA
jgi:hypothetical protein